MRKLVIAAAVSMSLATISANTQALSLGEIEMYSALNQTLDAEINILSFAPGELDGVSVGLAPAQAFAAAGLQRAQSLDAIRFVVERRPDGVPVVKVTSNGPIVEPFLSFLLQVDSPLGERFVREYTVLLDPPVFAAQQNELIAPVPAIIQSADAQSGVGVSSAIARNTGLEEGVELDLSAELGGESPLVTFDQLTVDSDVDASFLNANTLSDNLLDDSDAVGETIELVQNLDDPLQVGADDGGVLLDIQAELLDQVPEFVDSGDGFDVQLDQLAVTDNAIVDGAADGDLQDIAGNIVSLDSLVADPVSDSGGDSFTSEIPSATVGEVIDLNEIDLGSNIVGDAATTDLLAVVDGSEAVDLNGGEFEPQVTLERVRTVEVPVGADRGSSPSNQVIASTDELLGEAIDISGLVPGEDNDFSSGSEAIAFSTDTYRVGTNQTLWSIARTVKATGVSTPTMVAAILESNPDAFIEGDGNRLRNGSVLRIPANLASTSIVRRPETTVAQQESPQAGGAGTELEPPTVQDSLTIVGVDESASGDSMASAGGLSGASDLDRDLEAVNKKMMLAQEELTSESLQRDELSSRVVELEDSLATMKKLITLRESELGNLQTELETTDDDAAGSMATDDNARDLEVSEAEKTAIQDELARQQESISADATIAQERIDAQADADRNLASAEAEAKSVRLESEEDALKAQLAQLQLEKAELIETAQNDKLALVQQAEAEKAELLAEAEAERERVQAKLEAEKARISEAAEVESARVVEEARLDKENLVAEANAERERLALETDAMRVRLEALEEEKDRLLAESEADKAQLQETTKQAELDQSRLLAEAEAEKLRFEEESTKVKDRLAALQAEASANLTDAGDEGADVAGTMADKTTELGTDAADKLKAMTGAGAAAAGGLLAAAPLQKELGARKNVLAIGGGLAFVGLLGAWAMRRRRAPVVKSDRDIPVDIDTNDDVGVPKRSQFDARDSRFEEVEEPRSTMGTAAVAASAAAAATGAVVARDDSSDMSRAGDDVPVVHDRVDGETATARQLIDDAQLDDTITEADVYVRYGLHGQAEDLLQAAIERAPNNEAYHLKLLENYHDQKNVDGFKAAATNYNGRFKASGQWQRVAEMGRSIDPHEGLYTGDGVSDDSSVSGGAMAAGAAATAAAVAAVSSVNTNASANFDETMDAGAEFNVDDLAATGDFSRADDTFGFDDLDDISLDEVDLAALDDDGTLNLEEIAGDQMSGLDLGSLDLTNPDGDSTLDNLTLDDADLNSLGDVTSGVRSGLESDLDLPDSLSADSNEMETMLDLAKAYIDMGDPDSAANALKDIVANGNAAQQQEASDLLKNLT